MHSLKNWSWVEIFAKYPRFNEVIQKFELPLWSRAETFAKISHFWITAPATTSWSFCSKNSFDVVTWTLELALLSRADIFTKIGSFNDITQNFDLSLLSQAKMFHKTKQFHDFTWKFELALLLRGNLSTKIKQFCWCDLKLWTAPIITR